MAAHAVIFKSLFVVVPELPISTVDVLCSTNGDCATCMPFWICGVHIFSCLSVSIYVCVCVYGCVEKESDRCIEHCALAAHAQCQRMKKCVLFFFVVCAGINKQTDAHCVFKIFPVTFIVLEPCFFLEKKENWYKTTAQRQ